MFESKVKAPSILGGTYLRYKYDDVDLAIIQKPSFSGVLKGVLVDLIQEPDNIYDANAIAVYLGKKRLGYLYKGKLQDMVNDYINNKLPIYSYITYANSFKSELKIFLGFYTAINGSQNTVNREYVTSWNK